MIKINLIAQRKVKRARDPGEKAFGAGVGAILAGAAAVYFLVHRPMQARLVEVNAANDQLRAEVAAKTKQLVGYAELQKSIDEADKRAKAIERLLSVKVVPANVLHELGEILTAGRGPSMTEEMTRRTGNGPDSDPNRRFSLDWDPQHVWITSFVDDKGVFRLDGGAQIDDDVTQLAKRLQASVYFMEVSPKGGSQVVDNVTGLSYYRFTITGKVAY